MDIKIISGSANKQRVMIVIHTVEGGIKHSYTRHLCLEEAMKYKREPGEKSPCNNLCDYTGWKLTTTGYFVGVQSTIYNDENRGGNRGGN